MGRLTARDGKNAYYPKCFESPCYGYGECEAVDCNLLDAACSRLAAYEDITHDADGNEIVSLERLRELVEAEKDGRLVVLPRMDDIDVIRQALKKYAESCMACTKEGAE